MGIVENAKDAVKLVQKIDNIELYRKILDLQAEAIELTQQIRQKDEIIHQLKESLSLKGKLYCIDSAYYIGDEIEEEITDGPFCTKCFDVDHQKCRLLLASQSPGDYWVQCPRCKVPFQSFKTSYYLKNGEFPRPTT